MVKRYYKKYKIDTKNTKVLEFSRTGVEAHSDDTFGLWKTYIAREDGLFGSPPVVNAPYGAGAPRDMTTAPPLSTPLYMGVDGIANRNAKSLSGMFNFDPVGSGASFASPYLVEVIVTKYGLNGIYAYGNLVDVKCYSNKQEKIRGDYVGEIIAEEGTYPSNGISGSYWYVRGNLVNQSPTISGTDEDLGPQKKPFTKYFSVDDTDTTQTLNVTIKLNGATIQTISNATRKQNYTVDIDQATFDNLTLNAVNTIEISVSDGNGATAIRRWTFTRSNSNPTVSVDITNAGEQNLPFSVSFTPDDQDEDEITCKIFLDGVQVADLGSVIRGEKKTYSLGKMDFSKLRNGAHKVKIEVTDTNGGKGYGFVDFTKNLTSAYYKFTKETEGQALFVTVQLMAEIAEGAKVTVKVCNNALDTEPTWEEVPSEKVGGEYKFNNSTKTADNWAVGIWIQLDRGSATKDSYWYGAVGSYR